MEGIKTMDSTFVSGAICVSGSICVSGDSILHVSGINGEYVRIDSEPYVITLTREKKV